MNHPTDTTVGLHETSVAVLWGGSFYYCFLDEPPEPGITDTAMRGIARAKARWSGFRVTTAHTASHEIISTLFHISMSDFPDM